MSYVLWILTGACHVRVITMSYGSVAALKTLRAPPVHLSPHSPGTLGNYCLYNFAFSRMVYSAVIQYKAFPDRPLRRSNVYFKLLHVFSRLDSSFLSSSE